MDSSKTHLELVRWAEGLGLVFADEGLLVQAVTHRSLVNEAGSVGLADNQRLEFLGDAIVDFVVADWLFRRYPDAQEGELTSLRADIVRTQGLAAFATEVGLGRVLRLGRGEAAAGGHTRPANLCDAFEALVGALYLDGGLQKVRAWVEGFLERHLAEIDQSRASRDAKSMLQEHTQAALRVTPVYVITSETGPDHAKTFHAQVLVGEVVWGEGEGHSKQMAEQAAARAAIERHELQA